MRDGATSPVSGTQDVRRAVAAGSQVIHEVYVNGAATGRKFTSLVSAQSYASRKGGEVRAAT